MPPPFEYLHDYSPGGSKYNECYLGRYIDTYTSVGYHQGFSTSVWKKGPLQTYMGSYTSENIALFHHWEKDTELPLIQREGKLRRCIGWFVEAVGSVCHALYDNLESLTGLNWEEENPGFKRTGSALHRFKSSRVSAGGFASIAPSAMTRTMVTSDTMKKLRCELRFHVPILHAVQPIAKYGYQQKELNLSLQSPPCFM